MAILSSWPWKVGIFVALLALRVLLYLIEAPQRAPRSNSTSSTGNDATGSDTTGSGWAETLDSLLITIGLVFFIVQPFILQPFYIPSGSMENTLQWTPTQDRLLAARWIYRWRDPQHGDVIVFQPPPQAIQGGESTGDDYIKRCIGLPGDIVYADSARNYFRNGAVLKEPYVKWSPPITTGLSYSYDMKIVDGHVYSREYSAPGVLDTHENQFGQTQGLWHYQPVGENGAVPAPVLVPPDQQNAITVAKPEAIPPGMFLMLGDHRNNSSDGHVWGFVPRANLVGKAMCVFWPPSRIGTLDRMSVGAAAPSSSPSGVVPVSSSERPSVAVNP